MEYITYFLKILLIILPVVVFISFIITGVKMEKERPVKRTLFYGEGFRVIGYTETKVGPPWLIIYAFLGFLIASLLAFSRFILL